MTIDVRLEVVVVVPEALQEVPVDEALDVLRARLDREHRDRFGNVDLRVDVRQRPAELGDAAAERIAVLGAHLRRALADEVVGELPDRRLLAVHVDRHARAGLREPPDRRERRVRVGRVVQHLVGRHEVERLRRERQPLDVALDHVDVVAAARLPVRRARRLAAEVDGDDLRAAVGEHARVDAAAAAGVEDELAAHGLASVSSSP